MSGLTKHRDLAKKIDQIRHLLILNARFDGFKKDSHSNLQPNQKGYPSEFEHMNDCSPSPVQLATVFYVRSWYTYNMSLYRQQTVLICVCT